MNKELFVIACPPCDKDEQLKLGVIDYTPPKESTVHACEKCGMAVWIGRRQFVSKQLKPEMAVTCFGCAKRLYGGANMRTVSLGGKGGQIIHEDGRIFNDSTEHANN